MTEPTSDTPPGTVAGSTAGSTPAGPTTGATEATGEARPPDLPAGLLAPWPVIAALSAGWLVALVLAFTVDALHDWRPTTVAGLGVGVAGTSIFLWQRSAVRRGARGAQRGLT